MIPATPPQEPTLFDDSSESDFEPYDYKDWKYDRKFQYYEPEVEERVSKLHGRKGADALYELVGSKYGRDIVRRNYFSSPSAFEKWNAKQSAKAKCWADYEDYDQDGLREEFVVRRGDAHGPVIAVNGYTTKKSDWGIRKDLYKEYPERKGRMSMRDYVYEKYVDDDDLDKAGFATPEYLTKRKQLMAASPYALRIPNPSAYNIFVKRIVGDAYALAINSIAGSHVDLDDDDKGLPLEELNTRKALRRGCTDVYNPGWILGKASEYWNAWVKKPILDWLKQNGRLEQFIHDFEGLKRNRPATADFRFDPANAEHQKEFNSWLFAKKHIKKALIEYVREMFTPGTKDNVNAVNALASVFDEMIRTANSGRSSPDSARYKMRRKQ